MVILQPVEAQNAVSTALRDKEELDLLEQKKEFSIHLGCGGRRNRQKTARAQGRKTRGGGATNIGAIGVPAVVAYRGRPRGRKRWAAQGYRV
jgi:hypothetical protein